MACNCQDRISLLEAEVTRLTVENGWLNTWRDEQLAQNKRIRHHYLTRLQLACHEMNTEERTPEDDMLFKKTREFLIKNNYSCK